MTVNIQERERERRRGVGWSEMETLENEVRSTNGRSGGTEMKIRETAQKKSDKSKERRGRRERKRFGEG